MFVRCAVGREMAEKPSPIAILKAVAERGGNRVDAVSAKKAIAAEVKEYRDRCARREESKGNPPKRRKTLTLKKTVSYPHLLQALAELNEQCDGLRRDIENYIFVATNEDADAVWQRVESSLTFLQKLVESAKSVSKGPGRPSGSLESLLFDGLIDIFEQFSQSKAAFSHRTAPGSDKRPYGKVIDFIIAVISEHGLERRAMKPSSKIRALNPDALSDVSQSVAKLIQRRRKKPAPGELMKLWGEAGDWN